MALLGEGSSSLDDLEEGRGRSRAQPPIDPHHRDAWRKAIDEIRRRRAIQAEAFIPQVAALDAVERMRPLPTSAPELDAEIRALGAELASRDLRMGRLARRLLAGQGWSALGYASEKQYAEERVGVSLSSLRHRVLLARRCDDLPEIGRALDAGLIGSQAALLVGRIATPDNVDAWIRRAEVRTVVYLREEVDAVELRLKFDRDASLDPPDDDGLEDVADFRRLVQSGELFAKLLGAKPPGRQMSVTAGTGHEVRLQRRDGRAFPGPASAISGGGAAKRVLHRLSDPEFVGQLVVDLGAEAGQVEAHLSARRVSVSKPGVYAAGCHSASPALSVARGWARGRELGLAVQLVSSAWNSRGAHSG
jgi:hypothetical protein